jgi:hypothetical protein
LPPGLAGLIEDLDAVLAGLGDRGAALAAQIQQIDLQIGLTLNAHYGGNLNEIGADILVDPQHWPWIAEVNSGPATRFHEFARACSHVAFAINVAYRFRAGEPLPRLDGAVTDRWAWRLRVSVVRLIGTRGVFC